MLAILIKITLGWSCFALLYHLLLRSETFFHVNRIYLIFSVLFGLLLPFLPHFFKIEEWTIATPALLLPSFIIGASGNENMPSTATENWKQAIILVYWMGVGISFLRFLLGMYQIYKLQRKASCTKMPEGITLFRTEQVHLPFSFFKNIYFGKNSPASGSPDFNAIMTHEMAHAKGWHSLDVLLFEFLVIFFWFHPLAYWFKNTSRTVHEYLADSAVVRQFSNRNQYGMLLIRQSQPSIALSIANHFITSQLKKRIVMLTKNEKTPIQSAWRWTLAMPLSMFLMFIFSNFNAMAQSAGADPQRSEWVRKVESADWVLVDTIVTLDIETYEESVKIVKNEVKPYKNQSGETIFLLTDKMPTFPGGQEALMKFMMGNLLYPKDATKDGAEGKILVKFIVDKTGAVQDVEIADLSKGAHPALQAEALRVINLLPDWEPAIHKGEPVNCQMILPVMFKLH